MERIQRGELSGNSGHNRLLGSLESREEQFFHQKLLALASLDQKFGRRHDTKEWHLERTCSSLRTHWDELIGSDQILRHK